MNPVLDARNVPRYYVEFVLYHEMLHAWMHKAGREEDRGNGKGRRLVHTPEFNRRERMFRDYARAAAWEGG